MHVELQISDAPIDEPALTASRSVPKDIGAVVSFSGIVREDENGRSLRGIDYEAYLEMASHQFDLIFKEAAERWPIHSIRLVHRTGFVAVNEASLWIEVATGHRGEALAATGWIIDEMKQRVTIWKNPVYRED